MAHPTSKAGGITLRLLIWLPILLWAARQGGWHYTHFFLPLYHDVLGIMLSGFDIRPFTIIRGHEQLIKADYALPHMMVIGGQVLPHVEGSVRLPLYFVLTHPVMLTAAALTWPDLSWRGRGMRLLASLPVLLVLEAIDIPLVMYGTIHSAVIQAYDPLTYLASKPIDWGELMEGGGRFALCIAGMFVAAELHTMLNRRGLDEARPGRPPQETENTQYQE
ncbi:MAG: hypothetical protein HZY77_02790 [Thiobacillus sp.]|nr:hypothetical protein [Thiobacillus sp.]QLQ01942.1 MAG: hypothetical protein HZY77_02790 [Thiobacillus sp.]